MSKILITGGAGFLGSHLVDALASGGDAIVVLDNLSRGRLENIARHVETGKIAFVEGDIRDAALVRRVVEDIDIIFHLAAQSNVMGSNANPSYTFETNVTGTFNILSAAAHAGVQKLVFSSSREVYGEPERLPVKEVDGTQPKNLYGASKLAGEAFCRAMSETTQLSCVILRFGNLYGARDFGRVIPLWLERAVAGDALQLYGGDQVLDFLHVDVATEALLRAATFRSLGPINVASGTGTTLIELADRILGSINSPSQMEREPARNIEVTKFIADVTMMREALCVEPPLDPLSGISAMVATAKAAGAYGVSRIPL